MSYKINKTDGVLLVDLVDGRIDINTTDLTLIGRNFSGYGELFNENFIKILENFAAVSPPSKPLEGQLWYDKSDGRLKIWNGEQFRSTDTTVVSSIEPALLAGDIWIDSRRQQLYFNDGTGTTLAGPIFTRDQGPTGFKVETVNDRFGNSKTVAKIIINSSEVALISREPFEAAISQPGFGKNIQEGITVSTNRPNFEFRGVASSSRQLIDSSGDIFVPENFLKINANNVTTGFFSINNDSGLTIGKDVQYRTRMELTPKTVVNEILNTNADYKLTVNSNNIFTDALFVNTIEQRIGLWNSDPQATLDVEGDVRIAGNLTVLGDTIALEVENLKIQDKLIELATTSDSTIGDNIAVDGAGITVISSDGSKDWTWKNGTNSWTSNVNVDIADDQTYRIGGQTVLSKTELANTVTQATGLVQVGTLNNLNVANFNFASSTMTVTNSLTIDSADDIVIANSKKITSLGNPTSPQDATTKSYVDTQISSEPVYLEIDITGVANVNTHIKIILDNMMPSLTKENPPSGNLVLNPYRKAFGTKAIIHAVNRTATVITNPTSQTTKTFVVVDSAGVQNQSVVQDFTFSNTTNTVNSELVLSQVDPTDSESVLAQGRTFKTFEFQAATGAWQFLYDGVQLIP